MDISITINTFTNRFGIEEGCRMVKEAGFEAVDWSLAVWNSGLLQKQYYTTFSIYKLLVANFPKHDMIEKILIKY